MRLCRGGVLPCLSLFLWREWLAIRDGEVSGGGGSVVFKGLWRVER